MTTEDIDTRRTQLEPDLAFELLPKHDIVIDATADYSVEWLLEELAIDLDIPVVHVGLHRQGGLIRIDRSSRYSDPRRRLDEVPAIETAETPIREVGCMHPVSPTPPYAVHAAAAYATATVLDTLTDRWVLPDSAIHVLTPQPDPPYDRVGTIVSEQ
jgi:molybdopterin/thiamine biosynthesis adenylyltransferase